MFEAADGGAPSWRADHPRLLPVPPYQVIDCSYVLAEAIRRVHFDESLYALYTMQREMRGVRLVRQGSMSARSRQTSVRTDDVEQASAPS